MKSKTIILSGTEENKSGRGILTIYSEDDLLKCRIRLYNVEKLNKYCKLGMFHNNQVYSANLLEKNGTYTSSFVGDFDINKDFYTAIINTNLNNKVIIAGGTYAGHYFNDYSVFSSESEQNNTNLNNGVEIPPNLNNVFDDVEHYQPKGQVIEPIVDKQEQKDCNNCSKCESCIYKQHFYANKPTEISQTNSTEFLEISASLNTAQSNVSTKHCPSESSLPNTVPNSFTNNTEAKTINTAPPDFAGHKLKDIETQFNYIFNNYPQNNELSTLIENSRFAQISEDEKHYSIGAIYNANQLKLLCYAVKSTYNTPPPEELGKNYQWLPIDKEDPLTDGYYIVFQDATDLKILEL